jgi:hypothetical protein
MLEGTVVFECVELGGRGSGMVVSSLPFYLFSLDSCSRFLLAHSIMLRTCFGSVVTYPHILTNTLCYLVFHAIYITCHLHHMPSTSHAIYIICHLHHMPSTSHAIYITCHLHHMPSTSHAIYIICHLHHMPSTSHAIYITCHLHHMPSTSHTFSLSRLPPSSARAWRSVGFSASSKRLRQ